MPSPSTTCHYIETFLLSENNKTEELKHALFGLFSIVTPEEVIEKASILYHADHEYQSLRKRLIIQNARFLTEQFIFIHTPKGFIPFSWKKDGVVRLVFEDLKEQLKSFRAEVEKYKRTEEALQKIASTPSLNSFSLEKFIKEDLARGVPQNERRTKAEQLAHVFQSYSFYCLLKIQPDDIYEYLSSENNTLFSDCIRDANKITRIITYDLLWGASSILHQCEIARFYLEVLECCLALNDYHSAMTVLLAFSSASIDKLAYLEENIPELQKAKALAIFNPLGGFSALRKEMKVEKKDRAIPYLGIYINDLTLIKAIPSEFENQQGLNVNKLMRIGKICQNVRSYQSNMLGRFTHRKLHFDFLERHAILEKHGVNTDNYDDTTDEKSREWLANFERYQEQSEILLCFFPAYARSKIKQRMAELVPTHSSVKRNGKIKMFPYQC